MAPQGTVHCYFPRSQVMSGSPGGYRLSRAGEGSARKAGDGSGLVLLILVSHRSSDTGDRERVSGRTRNAVRSER